MLEHIAHIDLSQFTPSYSDELPHMPDELMRGKWTLRSVTVLDRNTHVTIPVFDKAVEDHGLTYTLLIGQNGVGKSFILRAIIDFFVDLYLYQTKSSKRRSSKYRFNVTSLTYTIGDECVTVERHGFEFNASWRDNPMSIQSVIIPDIIAAHFGLYDRFPRKTMNYNVPFYTYVGAQSNGNFISTNAIVTQTLFNLCEDKQTVVIERIKATFEHIGYEPRILVKATIKDRERNGYVRALDKIRKEEPNPKDFNYSTRVKVRGYDKEQMEDLNRAFSYLLDYQLSDSTLVLNLNDIDGFNRVKSLFSKIYILKQLKVISSLKYTFFRDGHEIDSNSMSSGELNMLATVINIAASVNSDQCLVLLDEPELNQHPNWQMSIIDEFNEALRDLGCHFLVATHSHFLVSDLPIGRSSVVRLHYNPRHELEASAIKEDTYGWSAEEILLEVFQTTTDRNMYLGRLVGSLIDRIKDNDIDKAELAERVAFLKRVSVNLHDYDPMKSIISTIVNTLS